MFFLLCSFALLLINSHFLIATSTNDHIQRFLETVLDDNVTEDSDAFMAEFTRFLEREEGLQLVDSHRRSAQPSESVYDGSGEIFYDDDLPPFYSNLSVVTITMGTATSAAYTGYPPRPYPPCTCEKGERGEKGEPGICPASCDWRATATINKDCLGSQINLEKLAQSIRQLILDAKKIADRNIQASSSSSTPCPSCTPTASVGGSAFIGGGSASIGGGSASIGGGSASIGGGSQFIGSESQSVGGGSQSIGGGSQSYSSGSTSISSGSRFDYTMYAHYKGEKGDRGDSCSPCSTTSSSSQTTIRVFKSIKDAIDASTTYSDHTYVHIVDGYGRLERVFIRIHGYLIPIRIEREGTITIRVQTLPPTTISIPKPKCTKPLACQRLHLFALGPDVRRKCHAKRPNGVCSSLADYDDLCDRVSIRYRLKGFYRAFMATSTQWLLNLFGDICVTAKIVNMREQTLFDTFESIFDYRTPKSEILDVQGRKPQFRYWWHGSFSNGTASNDTCQDWGRRDAQLSGVASQLPNGMNGLFHYHYVWPCSIGDSNMGIFCIETNCDRRNYYKH